MTRRSMLLMGAVTALSACVADSEPPERPVDDQWEAFKQSALLISEQPVPRYLYGGDMLAVGEEGLRREYEQYFGPRAGAEAEAGTGTVSSSLTVDSVRGIDFLLATNYTDSSGGRYSLTYCIQRSTFSASELSALEAALDQATSSWDGLVNVAFRHDPSQDAACGSGNPNVFFNVRNVSGGAFFASAFFPQDDRWARELLVDDSAFTTTAGGRDLQGILRHETGHILGFRHEHIWLGDCTTEGVGLARHVTAYDEDSVMHYPQCRPSMTGGYRQTKLDYQGAIELYGLAAAQITSLL